MEIEKIAVVGLGTMGSQIAVVCAKGGFKTKVLDTSEDRLVSGQNRRFSKRPTGDARPGRSWPAIPRPSPSPSWPPGRKGRTAALGPIS